MKKLLLVDDDRDFLRLLSSMLQQNFQVYEATGVNEALKTLDTVSVSAICSDFNMTDGTGLELLEKMRCGGINIPFLLMSGDDDSRIADVTERYGAAFCCKTDSGLLEKIKNL